MSIYIIYLYSTTTPRRRLAGLLYLEMQLSLSGQSLERSGQAHKGYPQYPGRLAMGDRDTPNGEYPYFRKNPEILTA